LGGKADRIAQRGFLERVQVIESDFLEARLPERRFRVVANPPFRLTTTLLAHLLDHPEQGPRRADLIVQREVAEKRTVTPPP
jgi:16S rRNA A1518/A1519 N6-dimethyltransferase RsmA/KsgA/DIM1 with predicted DNA glycosylase/AP lyase activity